MITLLRFRRLEQAIRAAGFESDIAWAEQLAPPADADEFAREAVYVIVNSGMKNTVALRIFERCMDRLQEDRAVRYVFRHPGKARAIVKVWREREQLFEAYCAADDKVSFLCDAAVGGSSHKLSPSQGPRR